ncbi:hypothetical protein LIER_23312 [Lithospermum erythrorhizon]|uniref:Uncharacterized protein n=1 Tax=Lithospermum erythrorhizon TaxID=34254 RepID=A0AAV3QX83_LITER
MEEHNRAYSCVVYLHPITGGSPRRRRLETESCQRSWPRLKRATKGCSRRRSDSSKRFKTERRLLLSGFDNALSNSVSNKGIQCISYLSKISGEGIGIIVSFCWGTRDLRFVGPHGEDRYTSSVHAAPAPAPTGDPDVHPHSVVAPAPALASGDPVPDPGHPG